VLGLDGDPTPGDPDAVRDMAVRLRRQAGLAENNTARLRAVAAGGGELRMDGDYAASFTEALTELPDELSKLARAYRGCGDALHAYAGSLAEAKTQSGAALRDGVDAHGRRQGALREVYALLPADRHVRLWPREELAEPSVVAATADLEAPGLREQIQTAARRGRAAEADRARASAAARQAAGLRGGAAHACAEGIGRALDDSGIKNKSWLRKAFDAVSAPFRSWDAFVGLCRNVAMVAGVVALFVSGPIGLALVAVAVVAGAAVLADTLSKYARGQASLGQLALDGLGVLPGGRGVVTAARLGKGARLVGAALRGGGGRLAIRGKGGAETLKRVKGFGSGPKMPINRSSVRTVAEKYRIDVSNFRVSINARKISRARLRMRSSTPKIFAMADHFPRLTTSLKRGRTVRTHTRTSGGIILASDRRG
jgi:uncharacterized protein YukE